MHWSPVVTRRCKGSTQVLPHPHEAPEFDQKIHHQNWSLIVSGAGPGVRANPIALGVGLALQPQEVSAARPHDEAGRQNCTVKEKAHNDWVGDPVQVQAKFRPETV